MSKKVELNIYKNNNKTKYNLFVKTDIPFKNLLTKMEHFTLKKFEIEIQINQYFEKLTQLNIEQYLSNYKGEKINIRTLNDEKPVFKKTNNKQSGSSKIVKEETPPQKKDQNKILQQVSRVNKINLPTHQIKQNIKAIYQHYQQRCLQNHYGTKKEEGKKICCQCKQIVKIYFVCLICPIQIIICPQCQQRQQIQAHQFKNHPLAKIKRWTQQIQQASLHQQQNEEIISHIQKKIEEIVQTKYLTNKRE